MAKLKILEQVRARTVTRDSRAVSAQVRDIPVAEIRVVSNVRTAYTDIDELRSSIERYGLLQPITVYRDDDGYVVKTGHRRFLAYQGLAATEPERFQSVRCIVSDAADIAVIQLIENVQREDLSQRDLLAALSALRDAGLSLREIAESLRKSEKYVKNLFIGINEIQNDEALQAYLSPAAGSPAGGTIEDISETRGIADRDARLALLEQKKQGNLTRNELRQKARDLKADSPAGGTPERAAITVEPSARRVAIVFEGGVSAEAFEALRETLTGFLRDRAIEGVWKDV
jgi:ParB family chromosome partitioning protein